MSLYLDINYLRRLSPRLGLYKESKTGNDFVAKFRCPICNDSQKKMTKTRGGCFVRSGILFAGCFNCGMSLRFSSFLKELDSNLYKEYYMDSFKEKLTKEVEVQPRKIAETQKYIPNIFGSLSLVRDLEIDSPAYLFCKSRRLPIDTFDFYYAEKFIEWTHGNTDKWKTWKGADHSRIIIPWKDRSGKNIGYSARSFNSVEERKYYRIFVDKEVKEHFFGLDRMDESKQIFVLEGEIDSLMIPNAIAVANGKLHTYWNTNAIYVPDGDRRNTHICKNISDMINLGLKVCLLPPDTGFKDLNEYICGGYTLDELLALIIKNTYQGLAAKMKFNMWRVIE